MPPSGLSIGLNLPSKAKKPTRAPRPKKPIAAFDDGDDDAAPAHSGEDVGGGGIFDGGSGGGGGVLKNKQPQSKKKSDKDISIVNAQLATFNELSKMAEKSAAAAVEDPSIYDYDGVWEDMKSVDRRKKKADELDAIDRKPKYMENLLVAAEVRKRDQLRAKEKLLQKEREAEGDEFEDKESFVTEAYKKQQEELRMIEEEEKLREGRHFPAAVLGVLR
jgi:coiled-coil domain-containing protein 55